MINGDTKIKFPLVDLDLLERINNGPAKSDDSNSVVENQLPSTIDLNRQLRDLTKLKLDAERKVRIAKLEREGAHIAIQAIIELQTLQDIAKN